ncbi:hypothetical protein GOBAR_AA23812 [Gossypium barbadense]|uniref:PPPDE domain-containing protein n=1 Tax=Gossypium barbadense TaxID=3634 RepID=A0A2P5X0I5_GOSBA|nr:hypothetical protein GOBAR_AA23812 [Gossypium barbadense]
MAEVILHIYDVTNSGSDKTNNTIVHINKIFKDRIGLGGIFHSAIQVYGDDEWSFGFCEQGSGVFCCPSRKNPLYTYREFMVLGRTNSSIFKVNQILHELSREWPGTSYDLLSKNCNHFCDELCERLGVQKLPAHWQMAKFFNIGWVYRFANTGDAAIEMAENTALRTVTRCFNVPIHFVISNSKGCRQVSILQGPVNRFANTGDAAIEMAENTALRFKQAKTEIVSASKVAYRFLVGVTSGSTGGDNPHPLAIQTVEAQDSNQLALKTSSLQVLNHLTVLKLRLRRAMSFFSINSNTILHTHCNKLVTIPKDHCDKVHINWSKHCDTIHSN